MGVIRRVVIAEPDGDNIINDMFISLMCSSHKKSWWGLVVMSSGLEQSQWMLRMCPMNIPLSIPLGCKEDRGCRDIIA